jgi:hypothetical protein
MSARPRPQPPTTSEPSEGPIAPAARLRAASEEPAREITQRAEALKIPWERLLLDEIQAEQILRRHVVDAGEDMPLVTALSVLPSSFLKSWRVRDQIQTLSCEARGASFRKAISELRLVFRRLIGQPGSGQAAFAGHLWLAYQRVLLLQRVCRAARRSRGTSAERLAFTCSRTRCSFDDAAWAVCREDSPRPGHRLDAAIRKAREEGFLIPRAATEARSFAKLRRIIGSSLHSRPRRPSARPSRDPVSLPARVTLPPDSI